MHNRAEEGSEEEEQSLLLHEFTAGSTVRVVRALSPAAAKSSLPQLRKSSESAIPKRLPPLAVMKPEAFEDRNIPQGAERTSSLRGCFRAASKSWYFQAVMTNAGVVEVQCYNAVDLEQRKLRLQLPIGGDLAVERTRSEVIQVMVFTTCAFRSFLF